MFNNGNTNNQILSVNNWIATLNRNIESLCTQIFSMVLSSFFLCNNFQVRTADSSLCFCWIICVIENQESNKNQELIIYTCHNLIVVKKLMPYNTKAKMALFNYVSFFPSTLIPSCIHLVEMQLQNPPSLTIAHKIKFLSHNCN